MLQEQKRQSTVTLYRTGMFTKDMIKVKIPLSGYPIACKKHLDEGEDLEEALQHGCPRKLDTNMVVEP